MLRSLLVGRVARRLPLGSAPANAVRLRSDSIPLVEEHAENEQQKRMELLLKKEFDTNNVEVIDLGGAFATSSFRFHNTLHLLCTAEQSPRAPQRCRAAKLIWSRLQWNVPCDRSLEKVSRKVSGRAASCSERGAQERVQLAAWRHTFNSCRVKEKRETKSRQEYFKFTLHAPPTRSERSKCRSRERKQVRPFKR